ncbi:MAG: hypothetical protein ACO1RT_13850 [Planctomycetaceae bacterium]
MPFLIATDEAGYGPKLGPLVIVATAWRLPDAIDLEAAFEPLRIPFCDEHCESVYIDDSKRVYKRNQVLPPGKMAILDVVCRAASSWASLHDPLTRFPDWLKGVAAADYPRIVGEPWFMPWDATVDSTSAPGGSPCCDANLIEHWSSTGIELCSVRARFITVPAFNAMLEDGMNKADILTESTCRMAFELIEQLGKSDRDVCVFSDRHGGRAFYGAALQHAGDGALWQVLREENRVSQYQLSDRNHCGDARTIQWSFSVDGDSFAPVSMSSMIAKWLRERAMDRFNQHFFERMPAGCELKPTAGYYNDADRYLQDIERAGLRRSIRDVDLIRNR